MEDTPQRRERPASGFGRFLRTVGRELATTVLPAILLALFVTAFVAEAKVIDGPSMQPNLFRGFRVIVEKVSYRFRPPRRGDVVLFHLEGEELSLVKRVVAVEGETVAVRGGHTYVEGVPIDEPWVTHYGGPDYPATLVPPNHLFVLGDNRENSRDSRSIGPIPQEAIRGHVVFIYWPLDQIHPLP